MRNPGNLFRKLQNRQCGQPQSQRRWTGAGRLLPAALSFFLLWEVFLALPVRAEEEARGRLVVEVIEDIPADERVIIEDQQVPLGVNVKPQQKSEEVGRTLAPGILLILLAILLAVREYRRAVVLKIRKDGYREEEKTLTQSAGRDKR